MISLPGDFPKTTWVLRLGVALQCFALGVRHLFFDTSINSYLTNYGGAWDLGPQDVWMVDRVAGLILVVLAGAIFSRAWKPLLPLIALWFLGEALSATLPHLDDHFKRTAIVGHAVRYLTPLALLLLALKRSRPRAALMVLLIGVAATFIAHGAEDIWGYVKFIELIDLSTSNLLGRQFDPDLVRNILFVIGVLDILAALVLLVYRWRAIALIMAVWGLITASSRVTAGGSDQWYEILIRANNAIAPLAIFFLLCTLLRHAKLSASASSSSSA